MIPDQYLKYGLPFLRQEAQVYAEAELLTDDSGKTAAKADRDPEDFGLPGFRVIGIGGVGSNIIHRLHVMGLENARTIAIDTDVLRLDTVRADHKILIGKFLTGGRGSGGFAEIGKRAAEEASSKIQEVLKHSDLAFIVAGMSGGTDAGAASIIAQIAKDQGTMVIAFVTMPSKPEKVAGADPDTMIAELQSVADAVILLDTGKLQERISDAGTLEIHSIMSQLIAGTIQTIVDMVTRPSLINIKLSDLMPVIRYGKKGIAGLFIVECEGKSCSEELAAVTLSHPLCEMDYQKASGAIMIVTGGPDLKLRDCENIAESIADELDKHADFIWNARIRKDFVDKVRVVAILTGTGTLPRK